MGLDIPKGDTTPECRVVTGTVSLSLQAASRRFPGVSWQEQA